MRLGRTDESGIVRRLRSSAASLFHTIQMRHGMMFFLPNMRNMIKISIDGFLSSKATYERLKVPWRRGLGFWGNRGCGKTKTLGIIMAQYPAVKACDNSIWTFDS